MSLISPSVSPCVSPEAFSKPSLQGISKRKYVRPSSVSICASGEPFLRSSSCIVGIPVERPSERFNSFKKSPNLLFLYLRALSVFACLIASILIERSGPA